MDRYIKTFFLTCWIEYLSQSDCLLRFQDNLDTKYLIIGAIEKTETEKEHFHVVGCLNHSIRFDTFKNILGNEVHIERLGKVSNAFDYITKEGLFFSNFDENIKNADIYDAILSDILMGLSFKDILKNYPKFALIHFDNLKKFYDSIVYVYKDDI